MDNIQDSYYELVNLIHNTEQQPQTELHDVFVSFVRRLKNILNFNGIALIRKEVKNTYSLSMHLGFQEALPSDAWLNEMSVVYDWVNKKGGSICLPSALVPDQNDLILALKIYQHDLGILHLITPQDPLDISQHQQICLTYISQQMSRSLLYLQHLRQKEVDLQYEKVHSMGLMLSGVMHELNSPLMSINGYVELLQQELNLEPSTSVDAIDYIQTLGQETRRVLEIVKSMLKYVRKQPLELESFDLNRLISRILNLFDFQLKQQQIQVHLEFQPKTIELVAEQAQIQQVMINLLTNALQACEKSTSANHQIWINTRESATGIYIALRDNAGGIEETDLEDVFAPFFTTKEAEHGTGVGLSLSHKMIVEHGGSIRVWNESEPAGACFEVFLPRREAVIKPDRQTGRDTAQSARILVIDNEPTILKYLDMILKQAGHQIVVADSLETALISMKNQSFDLFVSDFFLDHSNGKVIFEALEVFDTDLRTKMIFLTGAVLNEPFQQFLQDQKLKCLYKPFYAQELLDLIHDRLTVT